MTASTTLCPCGSNNDYEQCCGKYISGNELPQTAELLMRSRYTAFVTANVDYILKTYHPNTRPRNQRSAILQWTKSVEWTGLKVISSQQSQSNDESGTVEFIASYIENGQPAAIHETSVFKKIKGMWLYVSGEHK